MTNTEIIWLIVGLILGGATVFVAMCLVALGKLGDDPLPEIKPDAAFRNEEAFRRQRYQD